MASNILQNDYKGYDAINKDVLNIWELKDSILRRVLDERRDHIHSLRFFESSEYLFTLLSNIYSIFNKLKPELCIFATIPHDIIETIFFIIAEYLNIKTIIVELDIVPLNHYICDLECCNGFGYCSCW